VSQEAEVSDFDQALWQDMKQEAPDKLMDREGDSFDSRAAVFFVKINWFFR